MTAPSATTATPLVSPVRWALRVAPTATLAHRLVLAALADRADLDGRGAWPSHARLAAELGMHERTVRTALVALAKAGLIRRGDQSRVAHLPRERRPVVWDLTLTVPDPASAEPAAPEVAPVEVVPAPPDVIPTPEPTPPAAPVEQQAGHRHPPGNPDDVPCRACADTRRAATAAVVAADPRRAPAPTVGHPPCPVHPARYALRCPECPRETTTADHLPAAARRALEENKARARAAAARFMAGPPLAAFDRARLVEPELVGAP